MSTSVSKNRKEFSNRSSYLTVTAISAILFFVIYNFIYHLQSQNKSAAALSMSSMGMKDMNKFWAFPILQASGLVGLFTAFLAILLGLQQSRKSKSWFGLTYREIDQLHRHLAINTVVLVLIHIVATLKDAMGDSWKTVFFFDGWANPKTGWPQAVWGYNLGVAALYLVVVLGPTFYFRRGIGVARWKYLHRFITIFYIESIWHALILGLDISHYAWVRPVIWLAQIPVAYYLGLRFKELANKHVENKGGIAFLLATLLQLISWAGAIAVFVIVVSGKSAFIANI